jgi:DNA-binding NarL/FixJ family response regulator
MIRVAVLDVQSIARAGFEAVVRPQRDLAFAGGAAGLGALEPVLYRTRPDVLVVDRLGPCMRLRSKPLAPRLILCAAEPSADLVVPAALAGAEAIVDRTADVRELLDAIRAVGRGDSMLPPITPHLQSRAGARLGMQDRAIFAMTIAGTSRGEIARIVGLSPAELEFRLAAIVASLSAHDAREEVLAA